MVQCDNTDKLPFVHSLTAFPGGVSALRRLTHPLPTASALQHFATPCCYLPFYPHRPSLSVTSTMFRLNRRLAGHNDEKEAKDKMIGMRDKLLSQGYSLSRETFQR